MRQQTPLKDRELLLSEADRKRLKAKWRERTGGRPLSLPGRKAA